ncbi:hypothetical protein [Chitinophaga ginsengisoli]|uniref:Spy/CpxP family protein refolding chaperone n=1 Tax=Chitinophaga ginsengisoli TaxID=363837 RepID=A0A2P8GH41_9BACT|nr:hypothetical protein [Chitinophaga ginsengisoli]PSL33288.1 hypothetical protein CLV42_103271 [Chitinophaga ginsengisoli]
MKSNNTTKGIAVALTLLFMLSGQLVMAQRGTAMQDKTPQERAKFQTEIMKSKLALDSVQLEQVEAINLKYALKNEPVIKSDDSKFSKFKQLKSSQKEKEAELKKILTAEQFKQYQAFQDEMKAQLKERRKEQ